MLNVCIFSQGFEYGNFKAFIRVPTFITSFLSSNYIISYDQLTKKSPYISLFTFINIRGYSFSRIPNIFLKWQSFLLMRTGLRSLMLGFI